MKKLFTLFIALIAGVGTICAEKDGTPSKVIQQNNDDSRAEYVVMKVWLPIKNRPDPEFIEIIGNFIAGEQGVFMEWNESYWFVELEAKADHSFKFRSAVSWDEEIEIYHAEDKEWRTIGENELVFGQLWNDDQWKGAVCKFIQLDFSNPKCYRWKGDYTYVVLSLTSDKTKGNVTGDGLYENGDNVTFYATANYGYHFMCWSDGSKQNPRVMTLTKDTTLEAVFEPNKYSVSAADNPQGTISGLGTYEFNSSCTIEAIPNFGYHFIQWSDGHTENPREFVITQDTVFSAEFSTNTSGQCGNNLYWTFSNGQLSITGRGDMYPYTQNTIPWILLKPEIKTVSCSPEMTSISDYAFSNINTSKFNTIILPTNLVSIGAHAFDGDSFLETVDFGSNLESIGSYAFKGCTRILTMTSWADFTPNTEYTSMADVSSYAELYVLSSAFRKFQIDSNWNRFILREIGATKKTEDVSEVSVTPTNNAAEITWPSVIGADTYELVVKDKSGKIVCTLVFNSNGQLTSIAFAAPMRGDPPQKTQTAGFSFTVTGLNSGTGYDMTMTAKNSSGGVLKTETITFVTNGAQGIEDVGRNDVRSTKVIKDGQILILRGEKTYTLQGQEVK